MVKKKEQMKKLYIVRHAKSSWKFPELDDFDRPLNKRGKRDAPRMGQFLKEKDLQVDMLLSSSAARAKRTAEILADSLSLPANKIKFDREIYESDTMGLQKIVSRLDDRYTDAMLVGHNPGMTYFANMLANIRIDNIPTCGVVCVNLKISSWKEISENCGTLNFFEIPKNLTSL